MGESANSYFQPALIFQHVSWTNHLADPGPRKIIIYTRKEIPLRALHASGRFLGIAHHFGI